MLDQLMQLIQQSSQETVVNNPEVPNEANEAVMNEAQQTIANGLRGLADTGDLQALATAAAQGQEIQNQPAVQQLSGDLSGNLMQKLGLNSGVAKMIAATVIPMVLGKIFKGAGNNSSSAGVQGSGGGFDIGDLLSSITGGGGNQQQGQAPQGGGMMDKLSNLGAKLGLDKDGDGDVDMNDLSKLIK